MATFGARLLGGLIAALVCAGCGAPAGPVASMPAGTATLVSRSGLSVTYGLKRVLVRLKPAANQNLPPFETAHAILRGGEVTKIAAGSFDPDWLSQVSVTTRPDAAGGGAIYLRDAEGRLVGAGLLPAATQSGELPLEIVQNTAAAAILRSLDDNYVADGVVIRATPLEMASGYVDGLPGVERVEIEVSGPAYGDGTEVARLGTLRAPNLATYQWQPSVASGTFEPAKLAEPGTPLPFYLTTRAFDAEGNEVGVTRVKIAIVGTATVTIGVDEDAD